MNIEKLILCLMLVLLASCNPYEGLSATQTATAAPTATNQVLNSTSTPSPQCTVTTNIPDGFLNLRVGAGIEYSIIKVLHEGEILAVIANGDWLEVIDSQNNHGFINSRYCK